MIKLDLSSLPTEMPSSVCACNLEQILALSVSWLKYLIENNSNHVMESGLELWYISKVVVSSRPNWPGTWFIIISAWRTANHIWELPILHYHKIMVIYPYPFLGVISQLFTWIIFIVIVYVY